MECLDLKVLRVLKEDKAPLDQVVNLGIREKLVFLDSLVLLEEMVYLV